MTTLPEEEATIQRLFETFRRAYYSGVNKSLAPNLESFRRGYTAIQDSIVRQKRGVTDDDIRWLISQLHHNEMAHDYIKDELKCERCKRVEKIRKALDAPSTTNIPYIIKSHMDNPE